VLIVEAAFSVTVMLMEVPSGYFADIYGRRLSMILGAVFFMLSMVAFSFADTFTGFFFAEILGGLGISFHSGANEALLYDSLLVMKEERRYKKMQGNMFFAERVASVFCEYVRWLYGTLVFAISGLYGCASSGALGDFFIHSE